MTTYFQCKMQRDGAETIGWIEERGAKVGAEVELLSADGQFWRVVEVYQPGLDEAALRAQTGEGPQASRSALLSWKGP